MANYRPAFAVHTPAGDDSIKDFIANFYKTSDTPGKNTEWVDFFQPDATLVMEKKTATGTKGMCIAQVPLTSHSPLLLTTL